MSANEGGKTTKAGCGVNLQVLTKICILKDGDEPALLIKNLEVSSGVDIAMQLLVV